MTLPPGHEDVPDDLPVPDDEPGVDEDTPIWHELAQRWAELTKDEQ